MEVVWVAPSLEVRQASESRPNCRGGTGPWEVRFDTFGAMQWFEESWPVVRGPSVARVQGNVVAVAAAVARGTRVLESVRV